MSEPKSKERGAAAVLRGRAWRWIGLQLAVGVGANLVWLAVVSRSLRPSTDDYWFGAVVAEHGVLGGVAHWWQTWSAYPFQLLLGNALVGFPLVHLPIRVACAVPFWVVQLATGWLAVALLRDTRLTRRGRWGVGLLVALGWQVFSWGAVAFNTGPEDLQLLAEGMTHWQTLNGSYAIQFLILLGGGLAVMRAAERRWALAGAAAVGAAAGASGTGVSVALLAWAVGVVGVRGVGRLMRGPEDAPGGFWRWGVFALALSASAVLLHAASPGQAIRKGNMTLRPIEPTWEFVSGAAGFVLPYAGRVWLSAYTSPGALLVLVGVALGGWLVGAGTPAERGQSRRWLRWAGLLGGYAMLHCLVARFADYLIPYVGYWHVINPFQCVFLSVVCLGWAAGAWAARLSRRDEATAMLVAGQGVVGFLCAATFVNAYAIGTVQERKGAWSDGAAKLRGLSDIEPPGPQYYWWQIIQERRRRPVERGTQGMGGQYAPLQDPRGSTRPPERPTGDRRAEGALDGASREAAVSGDTGRADPSAGQ